MKHILSSLALAALTLTSCGGSEAAGVKKVELTASDNMQFSKKSFTMKLGQTLEISYKNVGKQPVETMGHNLVILKPGTDTMKFGLAAVPAKDNGHIPKEQADKVLANTKLLGPGEQATLNFKPDAAGFYPYVCSFPGHFGTMKGTIQVKE